MKERSFDEMIAYFNRRVSEMDIVQDYKIELLGMVAALGYKHSKTAQQWIPCSERLPEDVKNGEECPTLIYCTGGGEVDAGWYEAEVHKWWDLNCDVTVDNVIAWMPLPEPFNPDDFSQHMNPPED